MGVYNFMIIEKVTEDLSIGCEVWNRGNQAWGHEAKLFYKGQEIAKNRVRYYNRTWEAYQFDTVKSGLMDVVDKDKAIPLSERIILAKFISRSKR